MIIIMVISFVSNDDGCVVVAVFAHPQQAAQTGDFFGGCLRSVRINGQLVDWHAVHELVDVHVSGCPIADDDVLYA